MLGRIASVPNITKIVARIYEGYASDGGAPLSSLTATQEQDAFTRFDNTVKAVAHTPQLITIFTGKQFTQTTLPDLKEQGGRTGNTDPHRSWEKLAVTSKYSETLGGSWYMTKWHTIRYKNAIDFFKICQTNGVSYGLLLTTGVSKSETAGGFRPGFNFYNPGLLRALQEFALSKYRIPLVAWFDPNLGFVDDDYVRNSYSTEAIRDSTWKSKYWHLTLVRVTAEARNLIGGTSTDLQFDLTNDGSLIAEDIFLIGFSQRDNQAKPEIQIFSSVLHIRQLSPGETRRMTLRAFAPNLVIANITGNIVGFLVFDFNNNGGYPGIYASPLNDLWEYYKITIVP